MIRARLFSRLRRVAPLAWGALLAVGLAGFAAACQRTPTCDPKERVKLDFTVKDLQGHDVSLASYRGRPILLNFWATWCGPCKEEIPALIALTADLNSGASRPFWMRWRGASNAAVLGISVDDTPEDLKKFAQANKVNYPLLVGLGHDELLEAYDAEIGVPVSWVIGSNGCPLAKHAGGATKDWFFQQMKAAL
jgi:thiol-disulfide isomerase/thioredoxin